MGRDVRVFGGARVAAIGQATAAAVQDELGLHVDLCPESAVAEALAAALSARGQITGKRFLLLRADIAREVLCQRLEQGGAAEVRDVAIYVSRSVERLGDQVAEAIEDGEVDWVTFTSSATARNFVGLLSGEHRRKLAGIRIASIGPVTSSTIRELGLPISVQAQSASVEALVDAMLRNVGPMRD
jgi:uroporphyrinogen III methyltransferase/synthase